MKSHVNIRLHPPTASIFVNRENLADAATGFTLIQRAGELPTLTVALLLGGGEIDGTDVDVVVPDETRKALIALGWTPPPDVE